VSGEAPKPATAYGWYSPDEVVRAAMVASARSVVRSTGRAEWVHAHEPGVACNADCTLVRP
jgi:hypothetical protein